MDKVKISCPYCGLAKIIPRDKAPSKPVTVNCPKCKHQFPLDPAKLQPAEPAGPQVQTTSSPSQPPTYAAPPPQRPAEKIDPHAGLGGNPETIGALFSQSWSIFSSRFFVLIGLYILMFLMALIPGLIFGGGTIALMPMVPGLNWIVLPVGSLLATLAMSYGLFWGYAAFVHAVIDQGCGFAEALRRGRLQVWSFCWALSLVSLLVVGAYFLFFIPGVLFGVWFMFVPFIIAAEKERGMNSLLKSYQYVNGHWWNTFLKLFILMLVCGAVGIIPLIGPILTLLTTPFMLIYLFTMYYDLQQINGTHPVKASTGRKTKWIAVGTVGYILLPIIIIATTGGAFFSTLMMGLSESGMEFNLPQSQDTSQQQRDTQNKQNQSPPPQKILDSNATLTVANTRIEPGDTIFVNYNNIEEPAAKDWIALYRIDDPNDQYGQWEYLDGNANGTVSFLAPSDPGIYECRLFLDWPTGGYHVVDRSDPIQIGTIDEPKTEPAPKVTSPLDKFRTKNTQIGGIEPGTSFNAKVADPSQLYVYVYALNYSGEVRINDEPFYEIKGEKDMNYNYTGGQGKLKHGRNTIDVDYNAIPGDPWMTKIQIKVSTYDFDSGKESIIADWVSEKPSGKSQLTLELTP